MVEMSVEAIMRNVTAAIAAIGMTYKITDFQGNCVDLENGRTANGVDILSCLCTGNTNQQWILDLDSTERFFKVTNNAANTVVMSVPAVTDSATVTARSLQYKPLSSQINSAMLWDVQLNTNFPSSDPNFPFAFNFVPWINPDGVPEAVTAWSHSALDIVSSGDSPLTLNQLNRNDVQQTFMLTPL